MKQYAPIALFTYARADHTQKAVESLLTNKEATESELFIFSDGPKDENKKAAVEENRKYIHTITGFKSIHIIEREKNWGLANSLIAGITDVISKYGRIIVVEDDLILSPYFLKFMNEALEKYKDDDRVGAISAFIYPIKAKLPETFFMRYFHCWGWATWKRSWNLLNTDTKYLLRKLRFKTNDFDIGGAYGTLYCTKIGLADSWWVRLYASLFLKDKLTLYPQSPLASNNGFDGSGTHCKEISGNESIYLYKFSDKAIDIKDIKVIEDKLILTATKDYFKDLDKRTYLSKAKDNIKSFIRRLLYIDCM